MSPRALLPLVLLLVASACAGGGSPSASPAPVAPVDAGGAGEGTLVIATSTGLRLGGAALPFEAATGCRVALVDATAAELGRAVPGVGADVLAVSGEDVAGLVAAGAAAPLPAGVGRPADAIAPLRSAPIAVQAGRRYALPFAWGPDELLYRTASFPGLPPQRWDALYDPAYAGLVSVPDSPFQIANAAVVLGASEPFATAGEDLVAARELLRRQRPLVRAYGLGTADLGQLFRDGRLVLAEGRGATAAALAADGVEATIPTGTTTGWSQWWLVAAAARHPRCAAKWLNYTAAPSVQVGLADQVVGSPASARACALVGPSACDAYRLSDAALLGALRIAHAPPSLDDWKAAWLAART